MAAYLVELVKSTKATSSADNIAAYNDACDNCGYSYGEANDLLIYDDWFKCVLCKNWCHQSRGVARNNNFVCNKCICLGYHFDLTFYFTVIVLF